MNDNVTCAKSQGCSNRSGSVQCFTSPPTQYRLYGRRLVFTGQKTQPTVSIGLDWIVQCLTSPPTQYRLYGRQFLQVKRPNQQYQSTEGESIKEKKHKQRREHNTHRSTKQYTLKRYEHITQQVPQSTVVWGDQGMAPTEGRFARPGRQWDCRRGKSNQKIKR